MAEGIELSQPGGWWTLWAGATSVQVVAPRPEGEPVLWSQDSSVGNFPLLEKPDTHHPNAFLKCLTAQGSVNSGLASPHAPSPHKSKDQRSRVAPIFFFNSKLTGEWKILIYVTGPSRVRVF